MKKLIIASQCFLFILTLAYGNNIGLQIKDGIDELAETYSASRSQLYSKTTVSLVAIENITNFARTNYIGETIEQLIQLSLNDSLVFTYVDRKMLDIALDELTLSLSGLTDESTVPEIGSIQNVQLLLSGAVFEENENFVLTLKLVDVETTTLVGSAKVLLPKRDMIQRSEDIALESVVANGVGLTVNAMPFYPLVFHQQPLVGVGGDDKIFSMAAGAGLVYRISKNWKFGITGNYISGYRVYDTRSFSEALNISDAGKQDAYNSSIINDEGAVDNPNPTRIAEQPVHYNLDEKIVTIAIPFSYVWSPIRVLSLSFNLGPGFNFITLEQTYDDMPVREGPYLTFQRFSMQRTVFGIGFTAGIDCEYFILPRMALKLGFSYIFSYNFPNQNPYTYSPSTGEGFYGIDDRSSKFYGLNPFMMPDGTPLDEKTLSPNYGKIFLGFSVYF